MTRPRIICHMMTSIDGRIVVDGWPLPDEARRAYEEIHAEYDADGWVCGRVTMEPFAGGVRSAADVARQHAGGPREDFRAPGSFESFAVAIDASGKLAWNSSDISGDHVVAVLSERVSDEYLAFLRDRGVSYILAGKQEVDLNAALQRIARMFPVQTLMLEGGGRINGSFLADGLIDEISLLVAPIVDGRVGTPALFDADGATPIGLDLVSSEPRDNGVTWLKYRPTTA